MKSKNIEINKIIKNDKIKIKNEIILKKKMENIFGENFKKIYLSKCKPNKKCEQRCNNFVNNFLK